MSAITWEGEERDAIIAAKEHRFCISKSLVRWQFGGEDRLSGEDFVD